MMSQITGPVGHDYTPVVFRSNKGRHILDNLICLFAAGMKHWEKEEDEKQTDPRIWIPPYSQARSVNIEMTAYVLLTYCELKNLSMALPIVRWIVAQRNANGGFSSTQVNSRTFVCYYNYFKTYDGKQTFQKRKIRYWLNKWPQC